MPSRPAGSRCDLDEVQASELEIARGVRGQRRQDGAGKAEGCCAYGLARIHEQPLHHAWEVVLVVSLRRSCYAQNVPIARSDPRYFGDMAKNYLARTIPKHDEFQWWVETLGSNPRAVVPLPFRTRQHFDGLVIIYDDNAYVFDVVKVRRPRSARTVRCGNRGHRPIRGVTEISVAPNSMQKRHARVAGFRRIRYSHQLGSFAGALKP